MAFEPIVGDKTSPRLGGFMSPFKYAAPEIGNIRSRVRSTFRTAALKRGLRPTSLVHGSMCPPQARGGVVRHMHVMLSSSARGAGAILESRSSKPSGTPPTKHGGSTVDERR